MTKEGISAAVSAAVINKRDLQDFVAGNFEAIANRHPGEISLEPSEVNILMEAVQNNQTFPEICTRIYQQLLNPSQTE